MKPDEVERFERLAEIQERIAQLKAAEEELISEIVDAHGIGELSTKVGGRIPEIKQPVKFSKDAVVKVLAGDLELLNKVMVESWTIPAAKAKEHLTPEQLQQCYVKNGKPQIKFKEVEE